MADSPNSLTELLGELRLAGVRLRADQGLLVCDAPKGSLSAELATQIRANREAILDLLLGKGRDTASEWHADAVLPDRVTSSGAIGGSKSRDVFLTGGTGFLGAYLVAELLQQTEAKVWCLVRPNDSANAEQRLRSALQGYGVLDEACFNRVVVLPGDLKQQQFGLQPAEYERLVASVGVVFHNGAHVHHALPYASLKAANVEGTLTAIEIAAAADADLHFVSALSVLPSAAESNGSRYLETDPLEQTPPPQSGYDLTKWVSERLVEQAAEQGVRSTVYRVGPVSGDSRTGDSNPNDFLGRLVQGFLRSRIAPVGELPLDVLPVDYAARAIVWLLGLRGESGEPLRRYHLIHPESASSEALFEACQQLGHVIRRVSYAEWFEHLRRVAMSRDVSHPLYPLVALFSSQKGSSSASPRPAELPYDTTQADEALREAPFSPPALDVTLFRKYVAAIPGLSGSDAVESSREGQLTKPLPELAGGAK